MDNQKERNQGRKQTTASVDAVQQSSARGFTYEAEGARGASAARKENCQLWESSGGDTPDSSMASCVGGRINVGKSANHEIKRTGEGTATAGFSSILYVAEPSAQHGDDSDD